MSANVWCFGDLPVGDVMDGRGFRRDRPTGVQESLVAGIGADGVPGWIDGGEGDLDDAVFVVGKAGGLEVDQEHEWRGSFGRSGNAGLRGRSIAGHGRDGLAALGATGFLWLRCSMC